MIATLLIVFRETLEAGLIISIVLAACAGIKIKKQIILGIALGVLGAVILAHFTNRIEMALSGYGQEVFNACILLVATVMLSWQNIWMSANGRKLASQKKTEVDQIFNQGKGRYAIAIFVAIAVLREGSEIVLFLYSIYLSSGLTQFALLVGGVLGGGLAILVSYFLYRGIVLIPLRIIFLSSNILLSLIAAGLASQAAGILAGIDFLPALGDQIWDTSFLLSDNSQMGAIARAILGYTARPMGVQMMTWLAVLAIITTISYQLKRAQRHLDERDATSQLT